MSLPPDLTDALTRFAGRRRVLLGVDFDGTLAPFVIDPMAAVAAPGGLEALREAAALEGVHVVVLSGRDLDSLRQLTGVDREEPIVLIGSHGAQTSLADGLADSLLDSRQSGTLADLTAALEGIVARHDGPRLERKPASVVLHTRDVPEPAASAASAAAHAVATRHTGVHVTPGKDVVELSVVETSKGAALRSLATCLQADATAYFGDDVTDERAFEALDPDGGDLRVKVGAGATVADHRVAGIPEVVEALELFVSLRRGGRP
jgi:trehalose 6-phosphate phosphatase